MSGTVSLAMERCRKIKQLNMSESEHFKVYTCAIEAIKKTFELPNDGLALNAYIT